MFTKSHSAAMAAALAAALLAIGAAADCSEEVLDTDCVADNDLRYLPGVFSVGDCCQMCGETEHCQAFTYRSESQECWLKHDCEKTKRSPGLTSGQLKPQCAAEVLHGMDCKVDKDLDFFPGVASSGDCCDLCTQSKHCGAYTHRKGSQECWLKRECSEQVNCTGASSAILRTTITTTTANTTTTATSTATPSTTAPPASDAVTIHALHHNPHWECTSDETCRGQEYALFDSLLARHNVDFASLIMGGDYPGSSDARWQVTTSQSRLDKAAIVWDDAKWKLQEALETEFVENRAAMLGRFRLRADDSVSVVVASLHFPHDVPEAFEGLLHEMGERLWALTSGHTERFLVMADTNFNHEDLCSADLGTKLLLTGDVRSTDPLQTCCADGDFALTYDRIISNFGENFKTLVDKEYRQLSLDFTAAPFWAAAIKKPDQECTAAFHHPVLARLEFEPKFSSLWV